MVCTLCFKKTYFKNLPKILQWFCMREIKASCHNTHTSGIACLLYPPELLSSLHWPLCAPGGWHLCMELPGLPQGRILIGLGQSGYPLRRLKDKRRGRSGYCFFQLFLFLWQWWHPFVTRVHAEWLLLIGTSSQGSNDSKSSPYPFSSRSGNSFLTPQFLPYPVHTSERISFISVSSFEPYGAVCFWTEFQLIPPKCQLPHTVMYTLHISETSQIALFYLGALLPGPCGLQHRQEKSELEDCRVCYQEPGLQLACMSSTHLHCPEQVTGPQANVKGGWDSGVVNIWR